MLTPLYGFVHGDTLGVLVLVHDDDTIATLAESLSQAVAVRVAAPPRPSVRWNGVLLDLSMTVAQAGLTALDRVDLVPEGGT
jgi:hypothetical protein